MELDVTGYLVDAATWTSAVDPATFDLKAACPDAAACAYGVVVDNELHRLDDAGNDRVAAAVAGAGRCTNFSTPLDGAASPAT